jgi:hypothetical protein
MRLYREQTASDVEMRPVPELVPELVSDLILNDEDQALTPKVT